MERRIRLPSIITTGEKNLVAEFPDAKWVGLGGEQISVITMLRLPEKHYENREVLYLT